MPLPAKVADKWAKIGAHSTGDGTKPNLGLI